MENRYDLVLVGAGIMSSTLAALLNELEPDLSILIVERLDAPALESSNAFNNAGTGHAGNCELNYTPIDSSGKLEINKALSINAAFEKSLEFWASLTAMGKISPDRFLNSVPHISFVWGNEDIGFLRKRYGALSSLKAFEDMEWTEDVGLLKEWMPLLFQGRPCSQSLAATRVKRGTDIDFGQLSEDYLNYLQLTGKVQLLYSSEVSALRRKGKSWLLDIRKDSTRSTIEAGFVFLGAGGGALTLLQRSHVPEGASYGGFPVSGQWLICQDPSIVSQHNAKVYGKAMLGAPPMSVPHLDARWIKGKRFLLFGPFAGGSTRFLQNGSFLDLFTSIKTTNIVPMLQAGFTNLDLVTYLFNQIRLQDVDRLMVLRRFFPNASLNNWQLSLAGQRVQIIKRTKKGGILKMGTEVVSSSDRTLAALLGASPGASTAVAIMLEVLRNCWPEKIESDNWKDKIKRLIPSFGKDLNADGSLLLETRRRNDSILGLR